MIHLKPGELELVAGYVYKLTGISLDATKGYLMETRLSHIAEGEELDNFTELVKKAEQSPSSSLPHKIIDAITTNETLFFRDINTWELLKFKVIPDTIDRRQRLTIPGMPLKIRIWSAACSTGQEVYSIAITIKELLGNLNNYDISITGTDISDAALAQASSGLYSTLEIERGMPPDKLNRYFTKEDKHWRISDEIRSMVSFKKFNLMKPVWSMGPFDIIFCRNVGIYFAAEDKKRLFSQIADSLDDHGAMILGASEFITGITDRFNAEHHMRAIFYSKKD